MNHRGQTTLTISAVGFIAALLVDLYLIIAYTSSIELIIPVSLIVIVDTYFLVDGILAKVDEITALNIDKQNELTKVEKGLYSVAKREELARNQSMSALLDLLLEIKDENSKLYTDMMNQDKVLAKLSIKKEEDNTTKIVNGNERLAILVAQMAAAQTKSSSEAIEILNDVCRALEERNEKTDTEEDHSNLYYMRSKAE